MTKAMYVFINKLDHMTALITAESLHQAYRVLADIRLSDMQPTVEPTLDTYLVEGEDTDDRECKVDLYWKLVYSDLDPLRPNNRILFVG